MQGIAHPVPPQYFPGRVFLQLISEIIRQKLLQKLEDTDYSLSQALFTVMDIQEVTFRENDTPYRSELDEQEKELLGKLGIDFDEEA